MLNICALQGRLARDPELRQTNTGKQVATFTLAVDRGRRDANGQSQADWIPVIAWEKAAEFAYKWLHKGQMVHKLAYSLIILHSSSLYSISPLELNILNARA